MRLSQSKMAFAILSICIFSHLACETKRGKVKVSGSGKGSASAAGVPNAEAESLPSADIGASLPNETPLGISEDFLSVADHPMSTFSADVDTASYTRFREGLTYGYMMPPEQIRVEEFLNYFPYEYREPSADEVFSFNFSQGVSPWASTNRLLRFGIKGFSPEGMDQAAKNLAILVDVSGSMSGHLPLVKESLNLLADKLGANDRISIVAYAGNSWIILPSTTGDQTELIKGSIGQLQSGGSTNGSKGIITAYDLVNEYFIAGGVNRVILVTDGDFNVGVTSADELVSLVQEKSQQGVFLNVLGFGKNGNDPMLEKLTNDGNGTYNYVDSIKEADKIFGVDLYKGLVTIAKDLKFQIEFNPDLVDQYRLIGYNNRRLEDDDFANDQKDAGDTGAGHEITALYEVILKDGTDFSAGPLSVGTFKLRYKEPEASESRELSQEIQDDGLDGILSDADFAFQAGIAAAAMKFRQSEHTLDYQFQGISDLLAPGLLNDPLGIRTEFQSLVNQAQGMIVSQ
ncbi:vWA domain-containing protein [Pseudobacteriovorax antillogorgiicola]|uniref:Ca-activated chloride channel family protein n=1 Tax=Pseudobacteriovorax antillogorgiicola TaxID=1513793 RepID=A0A1Y6CFF1_9BACT|nr:von Willebrand factor type A domain-containing protein [Pseudobacteriovorax antillogorgiicola]TCS48987.1 Ca-activated chloride channel family protein [Pseudobacteriovorax antillogorgiicola]SMF53450.1 Ca-activated chloride channel family protein [Pseudobacteriovorax antillogorgiicola]